MIRETAFVFHVFGHIIIFILRSDGKICLAAVSMLPREHHGLIHLSFKQLLCRLAFSQSNGTSISNIFVFLYVGLSAKLAKPCGPPFSFLFPHLCCPELLSPHLAWPHFLLQYSASYTLFPWSEALIEEQIQMARTNFCCPSQTQMVPSPARPECFGVRPYRLEISISWKLLLVRSIWGIGQSFDLFDFVFLKFPWFWFSDLASAIPPLAMVLVSLVRDLETTSAFLSSFFCKYVWAVSLLGVSKDCCCRCRQYYLWSNSNLIMRLSQLVSICIQKLLPQTMSKYLFKCSVSVLWISNVLIFTCLVFV